MEFFLLILRKSSTKPINAKDKAANIEIKTKIFFTSAQSKVEKTIPKIISIPPNVGVPLFFNMCDIGPSFLIG